MDAEQFEIVWWWHLAELSVWIIGVSMFRVWWRREAQAEQQRNEVRERLLDSIRQVSCTQKVFADKIEAVDHKLDSLTGG